MSKTLARLLLEIPFHVLFIYAVWFPAEIEWLSIVGRQRLHPVLDQEGSSGIIMGNVNGAASIVMSG
jgi:hypothetical protein